MPEAQIPNSIPPRRKAIALLSGGLDSAIAAKIVQDLGIEVIGLHLVSPFGCRIEVKNVAENLSVRLIYKEKGEAYLDLVANPRYGYGKNMNPCIDCRIFMFQLADVIRQEEGADFIVTGEVVGQRPMSQNRGSMDLIDRKSPVDGLVLRPLSAQGMEPTIPEKEGWIDREKLFHISGRGRKDQLAMAQEMGLKGYSSPGGGCLLTESAFSQRLKDFFDNHTYASSEERMAQSQMLRLGRHFRLSDKTKVIVARNNIENQELEKLWPQAHGQIFRPENFDGPIAVAFGSVSSTEQLDVGALIARYGKSKDLAVKTISYADTTATGNFDVLEPMAEDRIQALRLGGQ